MKVVRSPYTGGTWYQQETYDAAISRYQTNESINYVYYTGGSQRKTSFGVRIEPSDFEYLIERMLEIDPIGACDAFNRALKMQLSTAQEEANK